MAPDLYTPLESLLLLQALHPSEKKVLSFDKISESLKANELLQESDSFTPARLESEALKEHFLQLLGKEAGYDDTVQNGSSSPHKRKRPTPVLETIDEAFQYKHLLPKLTNRLYFQYRDHAFKSIKDEESKYKALQKELHEAEREEREAREARLRQETSTRGDSRGVSSIQTLLRHDDEEAEKAQSSVQSRPNSSPIFQNGVVGGHPGDQLPLRNGNRKTPISGGLQQTPVDGKQPDATEPSVPFLPPMQPMNQGYHMGSPGSDYHRRPPQANQLHSHPAAIPSPRSTQNPLPSGDRQSASPIILPPPPGMLHSAASPTGPLDALADMAGQQFRANPTLPPSRAMHNSGPLQSHQLPPPRNYPPRGYPYYETHPPYQAPYTSFGQPPPPPANYQHPPSMPSYQNPHPSPGQSSPYSNMPQYQPSTSHCPSQHSAYGQTSGYYQQPPMRSPYGRGHLQRFTDPHTPISATNGRQRPPKPSPISTSATSTKWKNMDTPGIVRQVSPIRPTDAISPLSERASSLSPEPPRAHSEETKPQDNRQSTTELPSQGARGKTAKGRGSRRKGRGGRAASVASSTHAGLSAVRTRSQSVISQADELSIDQPTSTRKIKPEPSATSVHEDEISVTSHTLDEHSRKPNRQRRGTNRELERPESSQLNSKREHESPNIIPPSSPALSASSKPGYILGTRNFPKISAPLMNDISTHKLGNLFAKPLTDREAPSYKDHVYRPQDLRSIRNAINAGGKALAKVAEGMGEEANRSSVWIPESPEVLPPGGIVNSDQLEKELMRVFANAIMFNPEVASKRGVGPAFRTRQKLLDKGAMYDEDENASDEEVVKGKQDVSVVKDAREMFEAVEKKVAAWRRAEKTTDGEKVPSGRLRGGGSEEADELAGNGDDSVFGTVEQDDTPETRSTRRKR